MKALRFIPLFCGTLLAAGLFVSHSNAEEIFAADAVAFGKIGWGRSVYPSVPVIPVQAEPEEEDSDTDQLLASRLRLISYIVDVNPKPGSIKIKTLDGSVIVGQLTIDKITVATSYGTLEIPITKLRKFTPGLRNHSMIYDKIEKLLEELGGSDFKKREIALKALIEMGPVIRAALEAKKNSPNSELTRRIATILEKLSSDSQDNDNTADDRWRLEDVVETTISPYPIVGNINQKTFTVTTKYGAMNVSLNEIVYAERNVPENIASTNKKVRVLGTNLAQLNFKKTRIKVKKGEIIQIRASGSIYMTPWGSNYISTPNGGSNFGTYTSNPTIYGGTLVMRIGKNGKIIKAGSKNQITASADGEIQFAIAMQATYARGNYQFPGYYDVIVKINRSEKTAPKK